MRRHNCQTRGVRRCLKQHPNFVVKRLFVCVCGLQRHAHALIVDVVGIEILRGDEGERQAAGRAKERTLIRVMATVAASTAKEETETTPAGAKQAKVREQT